MAKYLLDTNICVFIMRGKYNLDKKLVSVGIDNCCISEITLAELLYGAECSNRPAEVRNMVYQFCESFEIVPIINSLEEYARQKAELRKKGEMIDDFDMLIACGAISNGCVIVTDNTKHFERLSGISIQNWVERKDS